MFHSMLVAAESIIPIFTLIFAGLLLRRFGVFGADFVCASSLLVHRVALPVMVFQKMIRVRQIPEELYLGIGILALATIAASLILWLFTFAMEGPRRGSFVQGGFRSNVAIVGMALVESRFGLEAMQTTAVIIAVMVPLYNFLSILILSRSTAGSGPGALKNVAVQIVKNPLIWGVFGGLLLGRWGFVAPRLLDATMGYFAQLTLPLALLGIGGSLSLKGLIHRKILWGGASVIKLLVLPGAVWAAGMVFRVPPEILVLLVLSAGCPTAVTSFAMAKAMGADAELAGEIISATTLFSMVTLAIWIGIFPLTP
jgi:hypothetical protein